jgi:exosome complex protein LRP1
LQSGNDKYDLERAERQAKERARAHIRFEEVSNARESQSAAPDGSGGTGCRASEDAESDSEDAKEINSPATVSSRKRKAASSVPTQQLQQLQQNTEKSKGKKRAKRGQGQGQGQGK